MTTRRRNGPWAITATYKAYENRWIGVEHNTVIHPDGSPGIYGVVRFANVAVGVLPLFDDGTVPIVGQHRFPHDAYSWELPEGGGPLGEDPLEMAQRELAEETGFLARHWHPLTQFDVSNSVTDERAACFLAWELTPGAASPEPSEELAHDRIAFSELLARCLDGRVRDSLTQMMVLTARIRADRGELPEGAMERLRLG